MTSLCSTIHWLRPSDKLPDVLLCTTTGLVEQGFRSAGEWFWACAASVDEEVVYWAEMPEGPR